MLVNDLRYALRMMRRTPVFTAAVILTIALAIGANTAVFSVVNTVMIRPLPFAEPSRLVQIAEKNDRLNLPSFGASVLNFLSWREQQQSFEELAAIGFVSYTISSGGGRGKPKGKRNQPGPARRPVGAPTSCPPFFRPGRKDGGALAVAGVVRTCSD